LELPLFLGITEVQPSLVVGDMGSTQKPHVVVLVPFPAQGHVAPHMQLAIVLNARGIHVTLVHTELHHRRLLRAKGEAAAAASAPGFGVEVIPDGLPLDDPPRTLVTHHEAMERNCLEPFKGPPPVLRALRDKPGVPPVSCVVADTPMPFAAVAAREVGVPDVQFFTASACGLPPVRGAHEMGARSTQRYARIGCFRFDM
jgi:cyanohydrin beta-glucosyltransferase